MSDVIVIPSAGTVPPELEVDFGPISSGLVPLEGRPIIEHVIDRYRSRDPSVRIVLGVSEVDTPLRTYAKGRSLDVETTVVPQTEDLAGTMLELYDAVSLDDAASMTVHFADTLVGEYAHTDRRRDAALYKEIPNQSRWTRFTREGDRIADIYSKGVSTPHDTLPSFVGVFRVIDPRDFRRRLVETDQVAPDSEAPSRFFRALDQYLEPRAYDLIPVEEWIDGGHSDTYYEAKKSMVNTREFNLVEIDERRNTLTKRTENAETLINEINWYRKIPTRLQPFTPQIYDFSVEDTDPYIEMEYVGHPSMSELFMYSIHDSHTWSRIYELLFDMLDMFQELTISDGRESEAIREMYVEKTQRRLDRLDEDAEEFAHFFQETVVINGEELRGLDYIRRNLSALLDQEGVTDAQPMTICHGDLCFPNILFDIRNNSATLVDARGSFGPYDIYGDLRYDLAKLRHSTSGSYGFLINGLFSFDVDTDGRVEYAIHRWQRHDELAALFDEMLHDRFPEKAHAVRVIEALLFLSMVPYHSDDPARQATMLAIGIEKFNESVEVR